MQQRSTHAVTCPLLSLVLQQEQCCSSQSVNSQRRRRVSPTIRSPTTAGYVRVDEVGSNSQRRYGKRGDPDSNRKRYQRRQTNTAAGNGSVYSSIHPFNHLFVHDSSIHPSIYPHTHSLKHLFIYSLIHSWWPSLAKAKGLTKLYFFVQMPAENKIRPNYMYLLSCCCVNFSNESRKLRHLPSPCDPCTHFLPRCRECSRGIAMGILSVRLSVCPSVCQTRAL